jgi:hypothetical protein
MTSKLEAAMPPFPGADVAAEKIAFDSARSARHVPLLSPGQP